MKLLHIIVNSKPEELSSSKKVASRLINKLLDAHPECEVENLDLYKEHIPIIDYKYLAGRSSIVSDEAYEKLDEKDKQIQDLHKQIEELINLNKNNQVLLKQQQDKEINQKLLEDHFQEVDEKLMDLRERMDEKKKSKKKFGFFSK
ncbi:MAG: NAD(P)H-dependent oxidoreductase [Clostridium baratii]|nr:NAD(P)H-dependent oxidoreductase [Clostridium baratii]